MTKRKNHHIGEEILEENAAHEGRPRAASSERAQESWSEFKEKANPGFERALNEAVHPQAIRTRVRRASRHVEDFFSENRTAIFSGLSVIAGIAVWSILNQAQKKRGGWAVLARIR